MICTDYLNSGDVTKMQAAIDSLRALKDCLPRTPVGLEGVVPSAYPEKMLRDENCDFVCQGEAFESIVELTQSLVCKGDDLQSEGSESG